jgi:hypothetical protein
MPGLSGLEKFGIAGITIAILIVGYKLFLVFIQQWKSSTDAVNRNSKSFEKLSTVFERQAVRDEKFQERVLFELNDSSRVAIDTNKKVTELHGAVVVRRRAEDMGEVR